MASTSLANVTAGTGQAIGRYFSVVSMVPSTLLVIYVFLLVSSGAWSGYPEWRAAVQSLTDLGIGSVATLLVGGVALGLLIHPIQTSIVQFFEGYWGASDLARYARSARIAHHQRRFEIIERKDVEEDNQEARRLRNSYPEKLDWVMPTRLGNVLRSYEMRVGRQYGLEALTILPHMALVARTVDVRYLDDQRAQLDLAVRLSFTALLACTLSVVFLWRDGLWLLVAMVPYGFAYLAYRGAIVTAHEYGMAMTTLVDLNRFALYERMRIPMPDDIEEETEINDRLMSMMKLYRSQGVALDYEHPQLSGDTTDQV